MKSKPSRATMALAQGRGGAYEHKFMCSTPHVKGHWCWTNAEIESLKSQAAQNREWSTIAKTFTIDGFVRHNSHQCFKKWWNDLRDPNEQEPRATVKAEDEE